MFFSPPYFPGNAPRAKGPRFSFSSLLLLLLLFFLLPVFHLPLVLLLLLYILHLLHLLLLLTRSCSLEEIRSLNPQLSHINPYDSTVNLPPFSSSASSSPSPSLKSANLLLPPPKPRPHMLPAETLFHAHLTTRLSTTQTTLRDKMASVQARNDELALALAAQRDEVEGLLGGLEAVLADLEATGQVLDPVSRDLRDEMVLVR